MINFKCLIALRAVATWVHNSSNNPNISIVLKYLALVDGTQAILFVLCLNGINGISYIMTILKILKAMLEPFCPSREYDGLTFHLGST